MGRQATNSFSVCATKLGTLQIRDRPRFFDQAGHQTTNVFTGNKYFFTKSCHRQTYQNHEQPPQKLPNSYFQNHFSASNSTEYF